MAFNKLLIRNGIVLPLEGRKVVFDPGSVLVEGDTILAVGSVEEIDADPRVEGAEVFDASGQVIMPGIHNGHLHSGLLRGTAESMSLWDWLEAHVDPAHKVMTPDIAEAASYLAYTEGLRFGTVGVMDMWRFMEGSARAAGEIGIRATLVPYVADEPEFDYFETIESNIALLDSHRTAHDGRVRTWLGLEHLFYCSPEAFRKVAQLAETYDTGIHTHSSESIWEVQESLKRFGRRPIEEFYNRGILGDRTVVAHCVWLDDREIELLAQTGTSVVHCPCSNMKLSSGPARIGDMRRAGIHVGLGSDGEKENNNLDLVEEMKFASLLQKVSTLDPTVGDPWDILDMATLDGAKALGLDDLTGSLEPGKRADIITIDLRKPHFVPVLHGDLFNVAAHIVFTASGHDVSNVWVDGRQLMSAGEITSVDVGAIMSRAQDAADELFDRKAKMLAERGDPVAGSLAEELAGGSPVGSSS